ncbi:MAG TPA: NUDIX domain-containing protein [Spirillospora sp.]|nr:NUDIX domain-containing protein [Spirillospora sp.]
MTSPKSTEPEGDGAGGWYGSFVAPHVLLRREDGRVLMLRRYQTGYADGWLCPPAGRIEPNKASEALWIDPARPPHDVIPHCALALAAILRGEAFGVHGWA